jgi:hypothetical protein
VLGSGNQAIVQATTGTGLEEWEEDLELLLTLSSARYYTF